VSVLGATSATSGEPPRDDGTAAVSVTEGSGTGASATDVSGTDVSETDVSGTSVTAGTSTGVETDSGAVEFAPRRALGPEPRAGPAVDEASEDSEAEEVPVEPSEPCRSA
jgi:hypothetical protein